ncbi:hypothetical protein Y09_1348 [Brachybacterium sp. SW0106-09]|uniref:hypothetical protein n=1 Tax=Brachybacterium sp. SW0106-09 TaxID=1704590 RepID=UPI0006B6651B|nr:hypothetical protein [Brachybacterium sp. SW0106-09]GAP78519.1 hypothetical protein Y09_1348 [Brachybacterium sp. SW0106-09]
MTILYRPVLIESVEQAEALPGGTVAICKNHYAREKVGPVSWIAPWGTVRHRDAMVGWTALVPIEAEEEWKTLHEGAWHLKADEDDARNDPTAYGIRRRYTTDWEETP